MSRSTANLSVLPVLLLAAAASSSVAASAQDTRTVTEPVFPAVCSTLSAASTITSGEPTSETLTNTSPDTSRIQAALSACPSGQAVELAASGANVAFLTGPIFIPNGRSLIVDGGVTVFASRNPADYQIGTVSTSQDQCGTVGSLGNGCYPLIVVGQASSAGKSTSTNSNLLGYGIINGRGYDKLIQNGALGTESWWNLADDARSGGSQNNPILVSLYKTNSAYLYKITLENSPMFHVKNNQSNGWTVWGAKIITPWTARNSDGIDPSSTTNVTITNSVIGDGDDEIALGASGSPAQTGVSITNNLFVSGHGISIGSYTSGGISNVFVNNANFQGQAADSNQIALRIKSAKDRGGVVNNITYQNVCAQNVLTAIVLDPFYNTNSGTSYPTYTNIVYANFHYLTGGITAPRIEFDGYDATHVSAITLDNVVFDPAPVATPAWQNAQLTFSNSISGTATPQVFPASLTTNAGSNVTYTNAATVSNANALNCTNAFPQLVGELYGSTAALANNPRSATLTTPGSITLNAMLQPVNTQIAYSSPYNSTSAKTNTVAAAPTASVQFLEGANVVGTAALGANGTLASYTLTNPSAGTHTYTAQYAGDSNYAALPFGSFTLTVTAGTAAQVAFTQAPPAMLTYGTAPGTVTVAVQDGGGNTTASNATVNLTVTGPNGYSQTYSATASNGTATFTLGSSLPQVGTYTYIASGNGLTASAPASETVNAATLTVSANAVSRAFGQANPALTYTISGYVNGDTSSVISGAAALSTTATANSPAGNYPITVTQGTLAATNYVFATNGNFLTVTGSSSAPQQIRFAALPSFASGSSYQLSARTTSGLAVTYTVSGPASVSGSTLTVNGPGTVTVTAANTGDADYAAAQSVSRTFTAR